MEKELLQSVRVLRGMGEKRAKSMEKLEIRTLFDLISYFPRDYEDRTQIKKISALTPDEAACVCATVLTPPELRHIRRGMDITQVRAGDESGTITLTFFNQNYIKTALLPGETYVFYGKPVKNAWGIALQNPEFEHEGERRKTGRIVPVYGLTAGISQNMLAMYVRDALARALPLLVDPIPEQYRVRAELAHQRFAYRNIHYPANANALAVARRRLIFEELLIFSIGLERLRRRRAPLSGIAMEPVSLAPFYEALPFRLTGAQTRAIEDALRDMCAARPMNRLVQGDVGSGKTMVAAACAYFTAQNGYQTALMAPTEILAAQHMETLAPLLERLGLRLALLLGSTPAAKKRAIKAALAAGEIDIVIGTHALLSEDVAFHKLGLVITDEQHRFGVSQRARLTAKGAHPHLLVMSATPIPRTLALILYGDLDVSIIDELPPGRQTIRTVTVSERKRKAAYSFMAGELQKGRQIYIVCPLVQENEALDIKSAEEYAARLAREVFPSVRVAVLHGKMKPREKEAVMHAFAENEIQILVATTVIEVGVNVPNATVMAVENAERFGLSQLHQLRGRVGRGKHQSYCLLFSDARGEVARERLSVLCQTNDGFRISEEDLRLRGPGDFFGTKQHGVPELRVADLARDLSILREAQTAAAEILNGDPSLDRPEHAELAERTELLFRRDIYGDIFN